METLTHFLLYQWQRKLLALLIALCIWIFVSHSITATKTISSIPIRVINLPSDKTVQGWLPNGFLSKRMTLTLTGTKDIIEQLEPGDIEILLDLAHLPAEGTVQMSKKNLVSLNPNFNLLRHITSVTHPEFILKMSPLMTEKVPVTIHPPCGTPPEGYQFLDIWPIKLNQTISGPQETILDLKNKGFELTFNLSDITKEELDAIKAPSNDPYDDEISFPVPDQWKKIIIPLSINMVEALNDPEAKNLHINFLRKEYIPVKGEMLPLNIFYPVKYSNLINPKTHALAPNAFVQYEHHIPVLKQPLFAYHVSKLFFDIVKGSLQIDIIAAPKLERETLAWGLDFVNHSQLEDTYAAFLLNATKTHSGANASAREEHFRQRFRNYMQNFSLFLSNHQPLELNSILEEKQIIIQIPNAPSNNPRENSTHAR